MITSPFLNLTGTSQKDPDAYLCQGFNFDKKDNKEKTKMSICMLGVHLNWICKVSYQHIMFTHFKIAQDNCSEKLTLCLCPPNISSFWKFSSFSILDFVDFQDFDIYETNPECQFILDMNSDDIQQTSFQAKVFNFRSM